LRKCFNFQILFVTDEASAAYAEAVQTRNGATLAIEDFMRIFTGDSTALITKLSEATDMGWKSVSNCSDETCPLPSK
jgi:hypothetical protein